MKILLYDDTYLSNVLFSTLFAKKKKNDIHRHPSLFVESGEVAAVSVTEQLRWSSEFPDSTEQ